MHMYFIMTFHPLSSLHLKVSEGPFQLSPWNSYHYDYYYWNCNFNGNLLITSSPVITLVSDLSLINLKFYLTECSSALIGRPLNDPLSLYRKAIKPFADKLVDAAIYVSFRICSSFSMALAREKKKRKERKSSHFR